MAARDHAPEQTRRNSEVPAFAARPGGLAYRFAGRVGRQHPVTVFFAALLSGFAMLAVFAILLGLLVTDVLVPIHAIGSADEGFVESLVADRTPVLTDVSAVGTAAGGAPVLPILAGLIAIVCALMRRWLIAGFAAFVLIVESATYRVSSLVVPRERPTVHRLDDLPADASYPSGHTAASIAVYAGLVLLITSKITNRKARIAAWAVAVLLPVLVAMSRMYRGMHHPLDVASGVIIGIGAITVVLFACRAASCAQRARPPSARRREPAERGPRDARRGRRACREGSRRWSPGTAPRSGVRGDRTPLWYEVPKAKKAPAQVERALEEGAELVFAWGGDGMVRRCVGVMAGGKAKLAVLPAGTSNLFATNMGVPKDIKAAVAIGLRGRTRRLDVGRFKSERFAVMAGAGFDAGMIRDADNLKDRFGRAAYVWSGARNLRTEAFGAQIEVDGAEWYDGQATCILVGNLGSLFGGVEVFPDAKPDDGQLELGIVEGAGLVKWMRSWPARPSGTLRLRRSCASPGPTP